jgi:hypothetical protein
VGHLEEAAVIVSACQPADPANEAPDALDAAARRPGIVPMPPGVISESTNIDRRDGRRGE